MADLHQVASGRHNLVVVLVGARYLVDERAGVPVTATVEPYAFGTAFVTTVGYYYANFPGYTQSTWATGGENYASAAIAAHSPPSVEPVLGPATRR